MFIHKSYHVIQGENIGEEAKTGTWIRGRQMFYIHVSGSGPRPTSHSMLKRFYFWYRISSFFLFLKPTLLLWYFFRNGKNCNIFTCFILYDLGYLNLNNFMSKYILLPYSSFYINFILKKVMSTCSIYIFMKSDLRVEYIRSRISYSILHFTDTIFQHSIFLREVNLNIFDHVHSTLFLILRIF